MHWIDPMNGKRATVILVDFRHPLLKLEKKIKLWATLWRKKNAHHGQNFKKVDFKAMRSSSRCGLAWLIPLYIIMNRTKV